MASSYVQGLAVVEGVGEGGVAEGVAGLPFARVVVADQMPVRGDGGADVGPEGVGGAQQGGGPPVSLLAGRDPGQHLQAQRDAVPVV